MKKIAVMSGLSAILIVAFTLSCADEKECIDGDGDGYGLNCYGGPDCNDDDSSIHIGAFEICGDGIDQNCDESLICDGGVLDSDGDEFGSIPSGGTDCDDSDISIHPGAVEVTCDDMDNDCDPTTLDAPDGDNDTWDVCGASDPVNPDGKEPADCNDGDDTIHPTADDICYDGIDQDCDGIETCYAYLTNYGWGLAIIDVSDPTNPGTPITMDTTGECADVYVTGGYAYVGTAADSLAVIDVSDPTNPGTLVYQSADNRVQDVYVTDDYAYGALMFGGLNIFDVSEPMNPGTPAYRDTSGVGDSWGVHVAGDYAYVTAWDSDLAIIDVSDPTNPGMPAYLSVLGFSRGEVYVAGDYAYVVNAGATPPENNLAIIDISDPENPGTPAYQVLDYYGLGVYVVGDYAYVSNSNSGLVVIDVSDPENPGTPIYRSTSGGSSWGVYVTGD